MVRVYESMWRLFATAAVVAVLALTAVAPASASTGAFACGPSADYRSCIDGICLFETCRYMDPPKMSTGGSYYCCY